MKTLRELATGSAAERFMNCPGSVALSKGIVESPKDYAEEGTRLHGEVEQCLQNFNHGRSVGIFTNLFVKLCFDTVVADLEAVGSSELHLEERLDFLGSSGGIDCYFIDRQRRIAYCYDWKFGMGVRLEARGNEQMAFYACAIKEKHPEVLKVHVTLIQPRLEGDFEDTAHVTHWTLPHQTIKGWRRKFEKALREVEEAKRFEAGPWCKFCAAKVICPAYVAFNHAAQEEQMLPVLKEMAETPASIERIAWMLSQEKRVTGWFPKAKEFLLELAIRGVKIPGFELVDKRANRIWNEILEPEEIAEKLTERGVENPWKPRELINFGDCKKQKINIDDLLTKPQAGKTLKLVGDEG